jgi:hypothetical protein
VEYHSPASGLVTCSQNGYLSRRGGCQNRWHSLVSCDQGDSTISRFDSPSPRWRPSSRRSSGRLCVARQRRGAGRGRTGQVSHAPEFTPRPCCPRHNHPTQLAGHATGGASVGFRVQGRGGGEADGGTLSAAPRAEVRMYVLIARRSAAAARGVTVGATLADVLAIGAVIATVAVGVIDTDVAAAVRAPG